MPSSEHMFPNNSVLQNKNWSFVRTNESLCHLNATQSAMFRDLLICEKFQRNERKGKYKPTWVENLIKYRIYMMKAISLRILISWIVEQIGKTPRKNIFGKALYSQCCLAWFWQCTNWNNLHTLNLHWWPRVRERYNSQCTNFQPNYNVRAYGLVIENENQGNQEN